MTTVSFTIRLESFYFECKKAMCLIHRSSPKVLSGTRRIVCTRNSQIASSLCQIRVLCSILTLACFSLEIACPGFKSSGEREIEEILNGYPALASHRSAHFFGLFFRAFPVEFHRDRGIE